jgi:hypothetical protein
MPTALSGDKLTAGGTVSALNVFGLLTGSFTFALSRTTPGAGQTLDTLTLSALNLVLGSSSFGVTVTGGTVTAAALVNVGVNYFGLVGSALAGSAAAGSLVSGTLSGGSVTINRASSGAGIDWSTVPGAPAALTTPTALSGDKLTAGGTVSSLNVFSLLTGTFTFALSRTIPAAGETLDALTLSGLNLVLGSSSFGVTVSSGTVTAAALTNSAINYFGLVGSGLGGSANAGSLVSGSLSGGALTINRASSGAGINWSGVTGAPAALSAVSGDVLTAGGTLSSLNVFGLLTGSFTFALARTVPATGETLDTLTLSGLNLVL